MSDLKKLAWRVLLTIAHRCAWVLFTVTRKRLRGVYVAIWTDGDILLIRNSYRKGWTFPGGLVSKGETWEQAAVRETFEEVGIQIEEEQLIQVAQVSGELGPNDVARMFETEVDGPVEITIDDREVVKAEFVSRDEALERTLNEHVKAYLIEKK